MNKHRRGKIIAPRRERHKKEIDKKLDQELKETFPASDSFAKY